MTDAFDGVPVFGAPPAGVTPIVRPSAYALLANATGRLVVVRTPLGVFLPGGGIDAGETVEQAIHREAREECAFAVRVGAWRARAIEHTWSPQDLVQYEKWSTFVDAAVTGDVLGGEADHEPLWLAAHDAVSALTPPSHRWAVTQWARRSEIGDPDAGA